ncbi:MAG: UbiD family decarboxylase [Planctomycetota bacterium]|nr:MAG: UbiD family decarboxylase [Planctomycetota bacterium]
MGYRSLQACVRDLERTGQLVRIREPIDPNLEAAEIQRRMYAAGGPAFLLENVKGSPFPMLGNLFGTLERARFLFRDALQAVERLVELKADPAVFWRSPWRYRSVPATMLRMLPRYVRRGPVLHTTTTLSRLPQLKCWPEDGGAFITLPQVYTEHPDRPGLLHSNLGMYRIQISGNEYVPDREAGLHYQIHRSIGVHHAAALRRGESLKVNVFIGGPPAMTLAAVMPLPEGLSELTFAGALNRRAIRMIRRPEAPAIHADADFCIVGEVFPGELKPEGPFGDHLGYYSLRHDFPVLHVRQVYCRRDAVFPFTVVGRPPQEDTTFGKLIHELTGPAIPAVVPGVHAVHAVDEAGVHPLLLAIGSERYVPYAPQRQPQELLTCANAILGQGQLSLAKYLWIAALEDDPDLDVHDVPAFFRHMLERVDWTRDLHFQTRTTIDTLDYSGTGLNAGSKLVIAAAGPVRRRLATELPSEFRLPEGFDEPRIVLPGVLCIRAPAYADRETGRASRQRFCEFFAGDAGIAGFPLVVLVDDAAFAAESLRNFLWVTFTRSDPAADVDGVGAFVEDKHFGCRGSLVIDARLKPHHAPPLVEDPQVSRRVDALAAPGGPLHGIL